METLPPTSKENSIPTITLSLSLFLEVLWGYKKSDLRDRAVPGREIVQLLEELGPVGKNYFHIQHQPDSEPTVWQKDEWKGSGEKISARDEALRKLWKGIDHVVETIRPKFPPVFSREAIRQMASDLITQEKWETLEAMGIDCSEYKKKD